MGEFDIVEEEGDETLSIESEDLENEEGAASKSGAVSEEEEDDAADDVADSAPLGFSYTAFLLIGFLAYAAGLLVVLTELADYCDPNQFPFGFLKK